MEFLRHRGAADDVVLLERKRLETGGREISRAGEAVVAGTDDDDVKTLQVAHDFVREAV